jgi:hypothetical protein
MLKPIAGSLAGIGQPQRERDDSTIRRVFMVLHGFYGNLFSSKFATGIVEDNGEDQGMASARRVWGYSLSEYDADTIKTALSRCRERHPEYPPSLPQFQALCDAAKPRAAWKPPQSADTLLIEESAESRAARRAEARRKATAAAHRAMEARQPKGLDALKQAIASAVREAGGDEAACLLRLDRVLSPDSRGGSHAG